jgi:hypothetical protein
MRQKYNAAKGEADFSSIIKPAWHYFSRFIPRAENGKTAVECNIQDDKFMSGIPQA